MRERSKREADFSWLRVSCECEMWSESGETSFHRVSRAQRNAVNQVEHAKRRPEANINRLSTRRRSPTYVTCTLLALQLQGDGNLRIPWEITAYSSFNEVKFRFLMQLPPAQLIDFPFLSPPQAIDSHFLFAFCCFAPRIRLWFYCSRANNRTKNFRVRNLLPLNWLCGGFSELRINVYARQLSSRKSQLAASQKGKVKEVLQRSKKRENTRRPWTCAALRVSLS